MAKTSSELEKEFIDTAKTVTGKSLQDWLKLVKSSGIGKHNDILEWLRKGHGLNHLQAQLITGIYLNNGKPVYSDENSMLESHFQKCPDMRPLFENISEKIITAFPGTQLIPKKTYLSFTAVREFVAINVKPQELRMGFDLGDEPFTNTLLKSKLTGPMPRISHMLVITEPKQFDKKLLELATRSYNRSHKK
jgi:Domain of unknown function (DUF5655)/Domain of unknown function (DUF4287)